MIFNTEQELFSDVANIQNKLRYESIVSEVLDTVNGDTISIECTFDYSQSPRLLNREQVTRQQS